MVQRQWQIKSTWGLIRLSQWLPILSHSLPLSLCLSLSLAVLCLITAATGYLSQLPARSSDWLLPPSSTSVTPFRIIRENCCTSVWKMNWALSQLIGRNIKTQEPFGEKKRFPWTNTVVHPGKLCRLNLLDQELCFVRWSRIVMLAYLM